MKKANKMMALTMAAAMLVPQMAFAGESEQTTFNIFAGVSALSPDNSEKPLVQQMNEAMGVTIDWNCVSGDTLTEKKNLILNAGVDMPDAFMAAELTDYELINYGSYGVLIPLEDYINEETMPNLTALAEKRPELLATATMPDGHIYGLPGISEMVTLMMMELILELVLSRSLLLSIRIGWRRLEWKCRQHSMNSTMYLLHLRKMTAMEMVMQLMRFRCPLWQTIGVLE